MAGRHAILLMPVPKRREAQPKPSRPNDAANPLPSSPAGSSLRASVGEKRRWQISDRQQPGIGVTFSP